MDIRVIFILIVEAALALALLRRCGALRSKAQWAVGTVAVALAFALRALLLGHETLD